MIASDQPLCFPHTVAVYCSSKADKSLLDKSAGIHDSTIIERRQAFCESVNILYGQTVYQRIMYDEKQSYGKIVEVSERLTTAHVQEVVADAIYTEHTNVALMLPVADCIPTVVYDERRHALALVHLGRHSSYAKLAQKIVQYFIEKGSDPVDILVWLGPHAQKGSYVLDWFDKQQDPDWRGLYSEHNGKTYLDLAGHAQRLFEREGVATGQITVSPVDTVCDSNYFSHTNGDINGRIAVLAMLRPL